jgi:WhiB family redox-sensing transcriptional regulator
MDWRELAACRDYDPEMFFPTADERTPKGAADLAEAKAVCAVCPVRKACLTWAIEAGEDHGVWGGTSEDERRAMRRVKIDMEWPLVG